MTEDDLIYAAYVRCPCGAGMAYRRDAKPYGETAYWDCSKIFLGTADPQVKHEAQLPFSFYEIKSEEQPSVRGSSTRPVKK